MVTHLVRATRHVSGVLGGERGRPPDALFETEHPALTDTMPEETGEGAMAAWMNAGELTVTADEPRAR